MLRTMAYLVIQRQQDKSVEWHCIDGLQHSIYLRLRSSIMLFPFVHDRHGEERSGLYTSRDSVVEQEKGRLLDTRL